MKFKIKIGEKEYEIEISEVKEGVKIKVDGEEFLFEKEKEIKETFAKPSFLKRDFSKKEIRAPITGVISEIFIKKGGFIKRGQKLLLLSAMKMENEIVSDFEGRVKEVFVKKDQKVKKEEILIILE